MNSGDQQTFGSGVLVRKLKRGNARISVRYGFPNDHGVKKPDELYLDGVFPVRRLEAYKHEINQILDMLDEVPPVNPRTGIRKLGTVPRFGALKLLWLDHYFAKFSPASNVSAERSLKHATALDAIPVNEYC